MFENKVVDLGKIQAGRARNVLFQNIDYKGDIIGVKTSCGCSKAKIDASSGNIEVSFKPEGVPYHLKGEGQYSTQKYITVRYMDNTSEVLTIKAVVYE